MGALDFPRSQWPAAGMVGAVIHAVFKTPQVVNELAQPFVGGFLLLLLQGREHLVHLTRPKLIPIALDPLMTLGLLSPQGIGGFINMRLEMRMIQDILGPGKYRHDGFA